MKRQLLRQLGLSVIFFAILITSASIILADAQEFVEAKKLIDAKTSCTEMTESQLEVIGDYLMEQIHPGESHEIMDKMMGGEGSESLRLMHIAMAKRLYCNDISDSVDYGMMGYGMMGTGFKRGINYGGMMNMAWGMMGNGYGMMGYGYWGFWNFLSIVLVVGLIVLVYLWIMKLWKEVFKKSK